MKRHIAFFLTLALSFQLSGCAGLTPNYREIEQLILIQTMGLDHYGGAVQLSLASANDAGENGPRIMISSGSSISSAMERIYNYSFEDEIFCYHVRQVLIGEKAAEEGIEDYLNYICRSPIMRIDIPLYVVRDSDARDLIINSGDESKGISEIMLNLREKLDRRGESHTFTTADVLKNLKRYGSALICALEYSISAESGKSDEKKEARTAAPAGYAVIRGGRLCKYISADDAVAVDLMMNFPGIYNIEVSDGNGGKVVLEVNDGGADIKPVWRAPGELKGLDIHLDAQFSVLEANSHSDLNNAEYTDKLTAGLEAVLLERANSVLHSSVQLKADFLGLAGIVERSAPDHYLQMQRSFSDILPELELSVTASGRLVHTNDMEY